MKKLAILSIVLLAAAALAGPLWERELVVTTDASKGGSAKMAMPNGWLESVYLDFLSDTPPGTGTVNVVRLGRFGVETNLVLLSVTNRTTDMAIYPSMLLQTDLGATLTGAGAGRFTFYNDDVLVLVTNCDIASRTFRIVLRGTSDE